MKTLPRLLYSLLLALPLLFAAGTAAQDTTPEQAPETLLEALTLALCAGYASDALPMAEDEETAAAQITPEGAASRTVLVFDVSALERESALDLMRFEDKAVVAAKAADVPLQTFAASGSAIEPGRLYGWLAVFYDADENALCRTTAYPAVGGSDAQLALVTFQGFIAQMASSSQLDTARYQADNFCSFDTPQYCESIFMGDDSHESITGTTGSDLISGAGGSDTLDGRAGNDVIDGGDGDDVIYGGEGDDIVRGDSGDDRIEGQAGLDTLDGGDGIDTVNQ